MGDRSLEPAGLSIEAEVSQHEGGREHHRDWVGYTEARDVRSGAVRRLEHRVLLAEVHPGRHAETSDEPSTKVRDDVAVEIGEDHHVEVPRDPGEVHGHLVDL